MGFGLDDLGIGGGILNPAGLLSFGGNLIGAGIGAYEAHQDRKWSAREAQKNRDWQEEMRASAHQTEVKDLLSAGLNPMLGFKGSGAPMPAPVQPQGSNTPQAMAQLAGVLGGIVTTALESDNIRARTDLARVQASSTATSARLTEAQIPKVQQELENLRMQGKQIVESVHKTYWEGLSMKQTVQLREKLNPLLVKAQELSNSLAAAGVPGAQAEADMWDRLGEAGKEGKFGVDVLRMLKSLFSGGRK